MIQDVDLKKKSFLHRYMSIIVESKSELPGDAQTNARRHLWGNNCDANKKKVYKLRWVRTSILFIFIELIS